MTAETHVVWHEHNVSREERERLNGHQGCVVWFTGLSGCGKSTVANLVDRTLHTVGVHSFVLDGDNVRHGLCSDLGFSDDDREENIRRVGEVCKLFADAGLIVMSAFISPFTSDRRMVRKLFPAGEFIEVFMDTPLETCEERDPKGLYRKARSGEIKHFTGIDSPYEIPSHPELRLDTSTMSVEACVDTLIAYLLERHLIIRRD